MSLFSCGKKREKSGLDHSSQDTFPVAKNRKETESGLDHTSRDTLLHQDMVGSTSVVTSDHSGLGQVHIKLHEMQQPTKSKGNLFFAELSTQPVSFSKLRLFCKKLRMFNWRKKQKSLLNWWKRQKTV